MEHTKDKNIFKIIIKCVETFLICFLNHKYYVRWTPGYGGILTGKITERVNSASVTKYMIYDLSKPVIIISPGSKLKHDNSFLNIGLSNCKLYR